MNDAVCHSLSLGANSRGSRLAARAIAVLLTVFAGCGGQDEPPREDDDDDGAEDPSGAARRDAGADASARGRDSGSPSSAVADAGDAGRQNPTGGRDAAPPTGASDGGSTIAASFETLKLVITETTCFGAGCHNDEQNSLDLRVDDQLYMRMRTLVSKSCGDLPIVNPGKPQESALVKILKGPCGETARMPLGCVEDEDATCVPPEYVQALERWIAMGAPQR